MRRWVLLGGAIGSEVCGSLSLKGALHHHWLGVVVIGAYLITFACMTGALKAGMPLGVAYGIWGALGVAATAILAAVFFGETLTAQMALGLGLIIVGVVLVESGAREEHVEVADELAENYR